MALQLTYEDEKTGIVLPEAYAKVHQVTILPSYGVNVIVNVYHNEVSRLNEKNPVSVYDLSVSEEDVDKYFSYDILERNTNPVRQAYLWMKESLPIFQDSIDV